MLKTCTIVIGVLLATPTCACSSFQGEVAYSADVIPSCIVIIDDSYWEWRDNIGPSADLVKDFKDVYELFEQRRLGLVSDSDDSRDLDMRSAQEEFVQSMCSEKILYSTELTRIMNSYGTNVSPRELLAASSNRLGEHQSQHDGPLLDFGTFEALLQTVLTELESRF